MTKPPNDFFSTPFAPYLVPELDGTTSMVDTIPIPTESRFGIGDDEAASKSSYLLWDSDVRYIGNNGKIQLPLSVARDDPDHSGKKQTSVVLTLHAPIAQRVIQIVATRNGDWPQVPVPAQTITDDNGYTETLISTRQIADTPKLDKDNVSMIYTVQVEWVYGLSRPPGYQTIIGGVGSETDTLKTASSPIDKSTPSNNRISLSAYFDKTNKIYNT